MKGIKLYLLKLLKQRCFEAFQLLFRAVKFLSKKKKIKVITSVFSVSSDGIKVWGLCHFDCASATQYDSSVICDI